MAEANLLTDLSLLDDLKIYAVVPAAGQGERIGFETPKQYIQVCGKPLVEHCLHSLSKPSWIQRIVVVVDSEEKFREHVNLQELPKVVTVQGKEGSRHRSIFEGLKSIEKDPPDIVVIHDGARPIVPLEILSQIIVKAYEVGAAGVVRPLVSTVIRPDDLNKLVESLPRSSYRNSEMPQAFKFDIILQAYKNCSQRDLDFGTECLAIAKTYGGVDAYLVDGTSDLWKVTYPQDIEIARIILPKHCLKVNILCLKCPTVINDKTTSTVLPSDSHSYTWKAWTDEEPELSLEKVLNLIKKRRIIDESRIGEKENFFLCKNSCETLLDISSEILSNSLSAEIITTALEHSQQDCQFLIIIGCVKTFFEAKNILNYLKSNFKFRKYSILTIFNSVDPFLPEAEFLPLRQTIVSTFPDCTIPVMSIVCQRECTNQTFDTRANSKYNNSKKQLGLIIEQSLKSTLLHSLHGQVLFL